MQLAECLKINANYACIYNAIVEGHSETCKTASVNFVDNFHDMRMSPSAVKSIKKAVNVILYLSRQAHYKAAYQEAAIKNAHRKEAEMKRAAKSNAANVGCTTKRSIEVKAAAQKEVLTAKEKMQRNAKQSIRDSHLCTFITLTLPSKQQHSDIQITKYCVNPFLSYARKMWGVRHYIWKKELQQNGNLHYHFVTDRYIDHQVLRRTWNRIVNQGKVTDPKAEDVAPFDYVDRYKSKMQQVFAAGWNEEEMLKFAANSPSVEQKTAEDVKEFEKTAGRKSTGIEYQQIYVRNKFAELERIRTAYNNEMKKPEAERWTSPNSTDISAIRTPRSVSAYVAKYIAKDVDDNPELNSYLEEVKHCKEMIYYSLRDLQKKKENNIPISEIDERAVTYWKELLAEARKYCPIQGKLWFKSASLTPFLRGAGGCPTLSEKDRKSGNKIEDGIITSQLNQELLSLIDNLKERETKTNRRKVIYSYGFKPDGTIDTNNIICVTLLINVFELQMMRIGHRYRYPAIVGMWQRFVRDCKIQNLKRGLYRRKHVTDNEYSNAA